MKRFVAFLLLALFALCMGLMFVSCGARKKSTAKTETITNKKDTVAETKTESSKKEQSINTLERTVESQKTKELDVELKSGEQLKIDEHDKNGNLIGSKTFTGSGKASYREGNKLKSEIKESSDKKKETFDLNHSKNTASSENTIDKSDKMDLDRKQPIPWNLIWLLVLAVSGYIVYNKAKSKTM